MIEQRAVPGSNLAVSSIGLGTAALGTAYGPPETERPPPSPHAAIETIRAALDAGVTLIDTAPDYGEAESLVGEATDASACVVATKLPVPGSGWADLPEDEIRRFVRTSVETSLRRLRREEIDILQIHNADRGLVEKGTLTAAMREVRDEGLVSVLGATVYSEDDALAVVEDDAFGTVQIAYSALDRRAERAILPRAAETGTAVFARSVLLRGVLSEAGRSLGGRYQPLQTAADRVRRALGAEWADLSAAALAFVLVQPGITAAIVGLRDRSELDVLLDARARFTKRAAQAAAELDHLPDDLLDPRTWPHASPTDERRR